MGFGEWGGMILLYLLIAALVGAVVGWLLKGARKGGVEQTARNTDAEIWETKAHSFERDLTAARGDQAAQRETAEALRAEVDGLQQALQARDAELAALQTRFDAAASFETDLASSRARLSALDDEAAGLRARLAAAEAELSKPFEPDPSLIAELNALRQSLTGKENELRGIVARNNELAALPLQIKARDLRLREWEDKHNAALAAKDEELTRLNAALAAATTGKEEEIQQLQAALSAQTAIADTASTRIAELEQRLADAEEMRNRVADLEAQRRAAVAQANEALREKDSTITLLQLRVRELEPLSARVVELQTQLAVGGREQAREVEALRARIAELEAAAADASAFEMRVRELETRHQQTLADREAELNNFRLAALEVENFRTRLSERDDQIGQLRTTISALETELGQVRAALNDREAELLRLREAGTGYISEAELLRAQVAEYADKLRAVEAERATKYGEPL